MKQEIDDLVADRLHHEKNTERLHEQLNEMAHELSRLSSELTLIHSQKESTSFEQNFLQNLKLFKFPHVHKIG